jgi:hypothetical protein
MRSHTCSSGTKGSDKVRPRLSPWFTFDSNLHMPYAEMIHHALQASKEPSEPIPSSSALEPEPSTSMGDENETEEISHDETTNTYTLKGVDNTSAGDNFAFLKSKLTWTTGDDGKERVLDEDGNG